MSAKSFLKGATIGAMLASVAALMLAPKSGKKTLADTQKLVNGLTKKLHTNLSSMKEVSQEGYEEMVSRSVSEYAKGKKLTVSYLDEMKKILTSNWKAVQRELKDMKDAMREEKGAKKKK